MILDQKRAPGRATNTEIGFRELKPGFGAEIIDSDLTDLNPEDTRNLVRIFHRHGALLVRNQNLSPHQLESFLGAFGELEEHTMKENCLPGHPFIYILSNRLVNGKPIGAHNDGIGWHTDYSYRQEPVMCTMLYAKEVPEQGSDTIFADLCAAYADLSPSKQHELNGLVLHHSYKYFMETRLYNQTKLSSKIEQENPDVYHPLIRTHPADGRKALWVSTGTVKKIVGMPNPDGLKLLDELVEFATQEKFTYRHKWKIGDVLIWDNRCTLHTGTLYDDKKYIREMHRLWVKGDKPF